ncbi:BREX-1 system adenine-specific DNA-methyltransferase PglX [Hominenteromicrobium sp.]|uniref:BREX-1 system adenine-specific DNA-methyltransferase PglX n=1 Tax=Hominenteromicrobium sp. TaxID=3073581 RepID=UPI003AF03097
MNKNAIQKFAIWARKELITQVSQRAYQYGIDESGFGDAPADTLNGRLLTAEEKSQRQDLIKQIKEKGYKQIMEEVAYTWFNRFIALRFMEVNNYLPSHIRVFSDASGAFKPEILNDVLHLDLPGLDSGKVAEYIERNETEALYRYLLLTQCNALNSALPVMFERMGGYTEMLLPNNILRQDSVLGHMVSDIPEEDWQDAVQIIGWLYQYYNTELKDDTFAQLKKNVKITKERIPAATQLFTPDWIVRYMVENSLGRIYIDKRKNEGVFADGRGLDEMTWHEVELKRIANEKYIADQMGWKYYIPEAEQTPEVCQQIDEIEKEYCQLKPEEIRVIDPCMGSGHILVYAFDVLMQIYTSAGWDQRGAAQSILKNNLFGLDIDDRAAQLAYFAVMMKARQYDRRLLTRGIQPNIYSIRESNGIHAMTIEYFHKNDPKLKTDIENIITEMWDAKEYGSILNITPVDFAGLYVRFDEICNDINMMRMSALEELLPLVKCAELLMQKYDVVVTNPPYMGSSGMTSKLSDFVKKNYPDTKSDMSTVCMERTLQMCDNRGYMSMINIPVWMFLTSYEKLRERILRDNTISSMVHPGRGIFGSDFGTTAFVIKKRRIVDYIGTYRRLFDKQGDVESVDAREKAFLIGKGHFESSQEPFAKIPGSPIAYWVSQNFISIFKKGKLIGNLFPVKKGMDTSDNDRFLRFWQEVSATKFSFGEVPKGTKWYPYDKGGNYRRWYGNKEYVVNYENEGSALECSSANLRSRHLYFKPHITWSALTAANTSFRLSDYKSLFDSAGSSMFPSEEQMMYVLALMNTKVFDCVMGVINPTINYGAGSMALMPLVYEPSEQITTTAYNNVDIVKRDWDSYETSWDFKRSPLV